MGGIVKTVLSPVEALLGIFDPPKTPKAPKIVPPSAPREPTALRDAVTNREGQRANQRSGGGGEPTGTKKRKLGA